MGEILILLIFTQEIYPWNKKYACEKWCKWDKK